MAKKTNKKKRKQKDKKPKKGKKSKQGAKGDGVVEELTNCIVFACPTQTGDQCPDLYVDDSTVSAYGYFQDGECPASNPTAVYGWVDENKDYAKKGGVNLTTNPRSWYVSGMDVDCSPADKSHNIYVRAYFHDVVVGDAEQCFYCSDDDEDSCDPNIIFAKRAIATMPIPRYLEVVLDEGTIKGDQKKASTLQRLLMRIEKILLGYDMTASTQNVAVYNNLPTGDQTNSWVLKVDRLRGRAILIWQSVDEDEVCPPSTFECSDWNFDDQVNLLAGQIFSSNVNQPSNVTIKVRRT